uniref:Uncharacterized protein n=1 Tax=Skeletonema marinoi TaxID=267567 RepID=A0A7S2PGH7_9STRA|mmetsp:Transcript_21852/g.37234  ORF Transcript_21852/g.37234 Transcript_21852/m.37234 type:complete len:637 (+) Transcript_21852:69-1979(+)
MVADGGKTISVAERIAALQKGKDSSSSTYKPSAVYKLSAADRPLTTMSKENNALADRIAAFQNTKTVDDDQRDDRTTESTVGEIVLSSPEPSRRSNNNNLFPSDAISSCKTQIDDIGFPSSAKSSVLSPTWKASTPMNKTAVSGNELKFSAAILTQSPQVVTESDCDGDELEAVEVAVIKLGVDEEVNSLKGDDNDVKQTEEILNKSSTSEQKKLSDTDASISFDSLPSEYLEPQVVTEKDCNGDELEAVEVAIIKLGVDKEMNSWKGDDNNVKQTENSCNEFTAELPIFTYNVPLKGKMPFNSTISEQKKLPDANATSNVSISFDSVPPEYLDSTWNLSPEKCKPVEPVSSDDDLFIVKASNTAEEWNEPIESDATPKEFKEHCMSGGDQASSKVVVPECSDNINSLSKMEPDSSFVQKDVEHLKKEVPTEYQLSKNQLTAQPQKPSLVSEAAAELRARKAARQGKIHVAKDQPKLQDRPREVSKKFPPVLLEQYDHPANLPSEDQTSPTGVDNFGTEEDAQTKFRFGDVNNVTVISAISAVTPDVTVQSDFTKIFENDLLDEQQRHLQDQSMNAIVQNVEHDWFNAKQLITKSVTSNQALIGVFESSLGVLADKVAEGYDMFASEFQDNLLTTT